MVSILISYLMFVHLNWNGTNNDNDTYEWTATPKGLNLTCQSSKLN